MVGRAHMKMTIWARLGLHDSLQILLPLEGSHNVAQIVFLKTPLICLFERSGQVVIRKAHPVMDAAVMSFHLSLSPTSSSSLTRFHPFVHGLYNDKPALFKSFSISSIHRCFWACSRIILELACCRGGRRDSFPVPNWHSALGKPQQRAVSEHYRVSTRVLDLCQRHATTSNYVISAARLLADNYLDAPITGRYIVKKNIPKNV